MDRRNGLPRLRARDDGGWLRFRVVEKEAQQLSPRVPARAVDGRFDHF